MTQSVAEANQKLREAVEARLRGAELPPDVPLEWVANNAHFTATALSPAEPIEIPPTPLVQTMPVEQLEAAWSAIKERQRQVIERMRSPAGCCDGGRCHPSSPGKPQESPEEILGDVVEIANFGAHVATAIDALPVRPGTDRFMAVLKEMSDLHLRKTLDYGSDEDALSNIRNSADVINVQPWAGAVLRMSDKMHRLRSYFRRGTVEFDGIPDTLMDLAAYSVIALVLYREQSGE